MILLGIVSRRIVSPRAPVTYDSFGNRKSAGPATYDSFGNRKSAGPVTYDSQKRIESHGPRSLTIPQKTHVGARGYDSLGIVRHGPATYDSFGNRKSAGPATYDSFGNRKSAGPVTCVFSGIVRQRPGDVGNRKSAKPVTILLGFVSQRGP